MADDGESKSENPLKDDFKIEYAKSNRSNCNSCRQKVDKDSIRIGVLTPSDKFDGEYYVWNHVACFFEKKKVDSVSKLKGFDQLRPTDQPKIKKFTGEGGGGAEKRKSDDKEETNEKEIKKKQKTEDTTPEDPDLAKIWEVRDMVADICKQAEMKEILSLNNQYEKGGKEALALKIADGVVKGAIPACPSCENFGLVFEEGEYRCHAHASEWSKCTFVTKEVERTKWANPKWWAKRKKDWEKSKKTTKEDEMDEETIFEDQRFFLLGTLSKTRAELTKLIKQGGGTVAAAKAKISDQIHYIITNEDAIKENEDIVELARKLRIPIVSSDFIEESLKAKKERR